MRTSTILAFSVLVVGGCSLDNIGLQTEADTISPDLVIAQVYGAGGNSNSTYTNDFIQIFNRGSEDVPLNGISVWYESAGSDGITGSPWSKSTALTDFTLAPGQSYLVQGGAGGAGTTPLPAPDATGTIDLSGSNGQVAVARTKPSNLASSWIDLVGYGNAVLFETAAAPSTSTSTTTAIHRKDLCVDTGDNASDFAKITAAPVNSTMVVTPCAAQDGGADMDVDLGAPPDMVVTDTGPYTAALNEVKWNPAGKDDGQEFIELIGSGTLPPHTFVVSVSGDAEAKVSTVGRINYAYDLSATAFGTGTPGLILVKAAGTTFPGVPSTTKIVNDASLNTAKLGNFTETAMLIVVHDTVATPIAVGGQIPASSAYTIIDSLAVLEPTATDGGTAGVTDPTYSPTAAILDACASEVPGKIYPPSGASRVVGNLAASTASAWYAGQAYGGPTDQFLSNVADCSTSTGAPQTWSMSPGLPNDMPVEPAPDLLDAPIVDLATPVVDLGTDSIDDLSASTPDLAHTKDSGSTTKPSTLGEGGCTSGGRGPIGWPSAFIVLCLAAALHPRRTPA